MHGLCLLLPLFRFWFGFTIDFYAPSWNGFSTWKKTAQSETHVHFFLHGFSSGFFEKRVDFLHGFDKLKCIFWQSRSNARRLQHDFFPNFLRCFFFNKCNFCMKYLHWTLFNKLRIRRENNFSAFKLVYHNKIKLNCSSIVKCSMCKFNGIKGLRAKI